MNHNFGLWFELWFKLWFGVWLKLWPKIGESSMISLRGGGLVAAFFWCAGGDPGARARPGPRDPGARAWPGPARAPKNAATNPPSRREIIDDSSIFGQSFNHTPNHNLNHNSNHNSKLWFILWSDLWFSYGYAAQNRLQFS